MLRYLWLLAAVGAVSTIGCGTDGETSLRTPEDVEASEAAQQEMTEYYEQDYEAQQRESDG